MRLDTTTRSGRMIRAPSRMASREPICAPSSEAPAMTSPSGQTTAPVARIEKEAAEIARQIDELGMGGRPHHAVAEQRHEGEHIEGARARPEDAVVEADGDRRGQAEGQGRHAGMGILVLHLARQGEIEGDGDEQHRDQHLEHGARQELDAQAPRRCCSGRPPG